MKQNKINPIFKKNMLWNLNKIRIKLIFLRTQVSICLKFCEEMHEKCKQAEYGGRLIGDIYKDGKSFCEAQDFQVINSNQQCFDFDPTPFSESIKLNFSDKLSLFLYINILFTKFFFLI